MHDKLRGLDELTHRIKKLRQEINKEADIKSASKELADDIEKTEVSPFVNCPVCKQRVLKYRYKTHKKKVRRTSEREWERDESVGSCH